MERVKCSSAGAGMITTHQLSQVCLWIQQIFFGGVFCRGCDGEKNRRGHCTLEMWSCLSALSSEIRNNVGPAFDSPDICIMSCACQSDPGDKTHL